MSNNINEKLRQDVENILASTKAAMEAVGLPMEKFVAFNEAKAPVLFSIRVKRASHPQENHIINETERSHRSAPTNIT